MLDLNTNSETGFFEIIRKEQKPVRPDFSILLMNADTLIKHGEYSMAMPLLFEVLKADSWHLGALIRLASIFSSQNEFVKEIQVREAISKANYHFNSLKDLADAYYKCSNDQKALEKYYEALSIIDGEYTGLFDVYKNIGNILVRVSDFDGALENYNKAFAINPNSDTLLVNLGTLALQQNDLNLAVERFRKSINLNPNSDKAWVGLSLVHQQLGDLDLSFANLKNAYEINNKNRTSVHLLCNHYAKKHDWVEIVNLLQSYLSVVSFDEELSLVLINALCVTNQFSLALLEVERVLSWNPQNFEVITVEKQIRERIQN